MDASRPRLPTYLLHFLRPDAHPRQRDACSPKIHIQTRSELAEEAKENVTKALRDEVHAQYQQQVRQKYRDELDTGLRQGLGPKKSAMRYVTRSENKYSTIYGRN